MRFINTAAIKKWFVLCLFLVLYISGCAGLVKEEVAAEKIVKTRAAERWQALIDGRLETAYAYLAPEYREAYSYKQYRNKVQGVGLWKKANVDNVTCSGMKCVATLTIYVTIVVGKGFGAMDSSSQLTEDWLKDEKSDEWFFIPSQ